MTVTVRVLLSAARDGQRARVILTRATGPGRRSGRRDIDSITPAQLRSEDQQITCYFIASGRPHAHTYRLYRRLQVQVTLTTRPRPTNIEPEGHGDVTVMVQRRVQLRLGRLL